MYVLVLYTITIIYSVTVTQDIWRFLYFHALANLTISSHDLLQLKWKIASILVPGEAVKYMVEIEDLGLIL